MSKKLVGKAKSKARKKNRLRGLTVPYDMTENHDIPSGVDERRVVSLETLRVLNKESLAKGYNRNIWVKEFEKALKEVCEKTPDICWRGLATRVGLFPLMIHKHKHGEPCEPHVRCEIVTGFIKGLLTLDVPMETFVTLPLLPNK